MEKLKPCPFCGGKAEIEEGWDHDGRERYPVWRIYCTKCYVGMMFHQEYCYGIKPTTRNQAISTWNRRVTDEAD